MRNPNCSSELKPGEKLDELQRNGYVIIQDKERFCFGMDAVLLSGFARVKDGGIQADSADMARRSVALNGLEEKIDIVQGDIREAAGLFPAASFDVVTCNPPYMAGGHGLTNPEAPKAIARHEVKCTFEDVAAQAAGLLKPGGNFFLVHRPFRLAEIMVTLTRYKLEPKRMRLVYPFADKEPNMVLLEANRGGRSRMTVERPLIVYREPGIYTDEIYDIYGY